MIFPFTIVVITIVMIALMSLTYRYEKESIMTYNLRNQFTIESLFSLVEVNLEIHFKKDEQLPDKETYEFPHGTITVSYVPKSSYFRIHYYMTTNNGSEHSINQSYHWIDEDKGIDE